MCGIIAVAKLNNSEIKESTLRSVMQFYTTELLIHSQSRGEDSTGVALCFERDAEVYGLKRTCNADKFVDETINKINRVWNKYDSPVKLAFGHCRKKSVGKVDPINAQPFLVENILGVHNGTLTNHELIRNKLNLKPTSEVDSELIFHILKDSLSKEVCFDDIKKTVTKLRGTFAVLAVDLKNPNKLIGFRDRKPIQIGIDDKAGLVVIASENEFIKTTEKLYNRIKRVYKWKKWPHIDLKITSLPDDTAFILDLNSGKLETEKMPLYSARDKSFETPVSNAANWNNRWNSGWRSRHMPQDRQPATSSSKLIFDKDKSTYLVRPSDFDDEKHVTLIYPPIDIEVTLIEKKKKTKVRKKDEGETKLLSLTETLYRELNNYCQGDPNKETWFRAGWIACIKKWTRPRLEKEKKKSKLASNYIRELKKALIITGNMISKIPPNLRGYLDIGKNEAKAAGLEVDVKKLNNIIKLDYFD